MQDTSHDMREAFFGNLGPFIIISNPDDRASHFKRIGHGPIQGNSRAFNKKLAA